MAFKILASFILASLFTNVWSVDQYFKVTLYEEYNFMGKRLSTRSSVVPDLSNKLTRFDNRALSACVYGIWIFYSNAYFNPEGSGNMEFIFSPNSTTCFNFNWPIGVAGTLSSYRLAVYPMDYRLPTISLFQYVNFQGRERIVTGKNDITDLGSFGHVKSIIITGDDDWTVYDQPNFKGNGWCLRAAEPGSFKPAFLQDLEALIGYDKVASIRRGCYEI